MPRTMQLNEAQTRASHINPQLERAEWNLSDRTQVALEVPVAGYDKTPWNGFTDYCLYDSDGTVLAVIEAKKTARDAREGEPRAITGHIDFLQVRNGAVHVLDYKPDARTNKPIGQLAIYALALTRRVTGLKLFDIKCAWFNEHEYCEFFPRTLFARR